MTKLSQMVQINRSCYRDLSNALETKTKTFTRGLEIKTKTLVRGLESIGLKNYFEENASILDKM